MNRNRTRLRRYLDLDRIPLVLAFLGEEGSGRKVLAYWFVAQSNCLTKGVKSCQCNHCLELAEGKFPYLDIYGVNKRLTVSEARDLIRKQVKVPEGVRRFVVIEDINHASKSAWNALLKVLENPPERTYFILIGGSRGLPETLASRCVSLYFGGLENSELVTEVEQDPRCLLVWQKLSRQDRELFLKISEGSWGRLRSFLGNDSIRNLVLAIVHNFTVAKIKTEYFKQVRDYAELEKSGAPNLDGVFRILLEAASDGSLVYAKRLSRNLGKLDYDKLFRVLDGVSDVRYQSGKVYEYLYMISR